MVGELIGGRYTLTTRLGSGGTSSVWRAKDAVTGSDVAFKLLHVEALERPDAVARFQREARILGGIHSPNVVGLLDRGDADGRPYLVFELVDGEDLRERLRRTGPLPLDEAVGIATQLANGLAAAHAARLVHRDLKPGNVLIASDGHVKLGDFGIARLLEEPGITTPGTVLGTGEYVSPEQALGAPLDARSDLYSLGIVLYEMLAGRPPFRGAGFADVAARHVKTQAPAIRRSRPEVPIPLARLIASLLAKQPGDRPNDAADVRDQLRGLLLSGGLNDDPAESAVVAAALDATRDAPDPPTGEITVADVVAAVTAREDDLAPWEDMTPQSMDFPLAPLPPVASSYVRPWSARRNAGPVRWLAILALLVAVGAAITLVRNARNRQPATVAGLIAEIGTTTTTPLLATTPETPSTVVATALPVENVAPFDPKPGGDGTENDDQADNAVDPAGNATWWESETYRASPDLVPVKGGVGLYVALTKSAVVGKVILETPGPGFTVTIYTTAKAIPPAVLTGWRAASKTVVVNHTTTTIPLDKPVRSTFVLVWVTRLAPATSGTGFSVRIGDLRLVG